MSLNTAQSELIKQTTETGERGGWEGGTAAKGTAGSGGIALQPPGWLRVIRHRASGGVDTSWSILLFSQSSEESAHVPPTAPLGLKDLNLQLSNK